MRKKAEVETSAESFIEPPQHDVIEKILDHLGLWQVPAPRAPPDMEDLVLELNVRWGNYGKDSSILN